MDNMSINQSEIIGYLITLYAIVPSIIITMMYGFLSSTENDLLSVMKQLHEIEIKNGENIENSKKENIKKLEIKVKLVEKFIIVSSKIFHISMAYYLIMLLTALISKCIPSSVGPNSMTTIVVFCVGSVVYYVYIFIYSERDIIKNIDRVFENSKNGHLFIYIYIGILHLLFPVVLPIAFRVFTNCHEMFIHLWWISLTIFHLLVWWLVYPLKYQPLTNLSQIKREMFKL